MELRHSKIDSNPYSLPCPLVRDKLPTRLRVALKAGTCRSPCWLRRAVAAVGRPDLSGLPSLFSSPHKFIFPFACRLPSGQQFFFEPRSQQAEKAMSTLVNSSSEIPWWKEPTRDQWIAWIAAWLGWTLDAFDFTIFLLIMVPIAES